MKIIIIICITSILLNNVYAQSSKPDYQSVKKSEKKWTMEQVKSMAAKYNLQNHKLLTESKNSGLLYADKVEIEKWCQNEIKVNKEREENSEFLKNSQYVRTLEDYFKLIDSYPSIRQAEVKSFGGEKELNKWRDKLRTCKIWRIYRNSHGGLAIRQGDKLLTKEETLLGKRIDNIPKF